MCAIIDACVFTQVFNEKKRERFGPLVDWITKKDGKLIIGGSQYAKEVGGEKCLGILTEYEKKNRLVKLNDASVDALQASLKVTEPSPEFDDAHLVAMAAISRCCVICTDEKRAIKYIKREEFYPQHMRPPRIYRNSGHAALCCRDHVVKVCR